MQVKARIRSSYVLYGSIVLFSILALIPLIWVLSKPGFVGWRWDWNLPPYLDQYILALQRRLFAWVHITGLGSTNSTPSNLYFWLIATFLAGLFGYDVSKVVLLIILTISGLSCYYLLKRIGLSSFPSISGSILYMYSPFIYSRVTAGHLDILFSYAFLPLFVAYLLKTLKNPKNYGVAILTSVLLTLASQHEMMLPINLILLTIIFCYAFFQRENAKVQLIKITALTVSIFFLLNAFWILPILFKTLASGTQSFYSENDAVTRASVAQLWSNNLKDVIRLYSTSGSEYIYPVISMPQELWIFASYSLPILVFSSLLIKKSAIVYLFSIVAVIGTVLQLGVNSPLGPLYSWSMIHVPFFVEYTNPNRWQPLVIIAYSVLLAFTLNTCWKAGPISSIKLTRSLFGAGFLIVLIFTSPMIEGFKPDPNFTWHLPVNTLNKDDGKIFDYFSNLEGDFRIGLIPPGTYTGYTNNKDTGNDYMSIYPPKPSGLASSSIGIERQIFSAMYQQDLETEYLGKVLGIENIKYMLLNKWRFFPDALYNLKTSDNSVPEKNLQKQVGLNKLEISGAANSSYVLYENNFFKPHIFTAQHAAVISSDRSSLFSMSYAGDYLDKMNLIFGTQLSKESFTKSIAQADTFIIYNNDKIDLLYPILPDKYRFKLGLMALEQRSINDGWVNLYSYWSGDKHYPLVVEEYYIDAATKSSPTYGMITSKAGAELTLSIPPGDEMEVYVKSHHGIQSGRIAFQTLGVSAEIQTHSNFDSGFEWTHVMSLPKSDKERSLIVRNIEGENALSSLIIAPRNALEVALHELEQQLTGKNTILLAEAEKLGKEWSKIDHSSLGYSVTLPASFTLYSPQDKNFDIYLRIMIENSTGVTMLTNNIPLKFSSNPSKSLNWYKLSSVALKKGLNNFSITPDSPAYLDLFLAQDSNISYLHPDTESNWENATIDQSMKWSQINPSTYHINVNTNTTFYLVFSERYDPGWQVSFDGKTVDSTPSYGFANSYYINKTGTIEISLRYTPQNMVDFAQMVTLSSWIVICIALLFPSLPKNRPRELHAHIKNTKYPFIPLK